MTSDWEDWLQADELGAVVDVGAHGRDQHQVDGAALSNDNLLDIGRYMFVDLLHIVQKGSSRGRILNKCRRRDQRGGSI